MAVYSNSKLRAFEQCPLQFRYRYLDRVPTDLESVEAFTGKRVHETLEWLYLEVSAGRVPELDATLARYTALWREAWHPLVHVVRQGVLPAAYERRGTRCVESYYRGNWPFDADHTLAVEAHVRFALGDTILIQGYIDRVARAPGGELLIHDYKTSSYLPRREQLVGDLQLAIYQLGAVERWPGAPDVRLIWHFLSFARKVTVRLGPELEQRRAELVRRVEAVERAVASGAELPSRVSKLCDWCSYRPICPAKGGDPARAGSLVLQHQATGTARRGSGGSRTAPGGSGAPSPELNLFGPGSAD